MVPRSAGSGRPLELGYTLLGSRGMREAVKIGLLALGAALAYGVALDQLTARISLEYFTVAHPRLVATDSPGWVALAWGVTATRWPGLALGMLLALAARAGRAPQRDAVQLVAPVLWLLLAMVLCAALAGALAYAAVRSGALALPEPFAPRIERARHARFAAVWAATSASYAVGVCGATGLALRIWTARLRESRPASADRPRDRFAAALFYGSLVGLALLVGLPLAVAWNVSGSMMRPPWYAVPGPGRSLAPGPLRDPRSDFGLDYQDVAFPTDGGAVLRGWLVPAGDGRAAVVLAGGGWSDRRSLIALAPLLHRAGYATLAFDYRERGASDGTGLGASYGWRESADVSAAVRFLKDERHYERVAVIGYSMGGTAAILAAAADPRIDAVVASTPGTTLPDLLATLPETADTPIWMRGLIARVFLLRIGAPLPAVRSLAVGPLYVVDRIAPRPLLLLHGSDDRVNSVADTQRLLARAGAPKELVVVAGAGHLDVLDERSGEVLRRILTFLDDALAPR
jgi:alpha-beta hydrolase superfamily lysophospholipase